MKIHLHYAESELENILLSVMFVSFEFNSTYFLFSWFWKYEHILALSTRDAFSHEASH